jgi:MOSC domain-containing protein YiiM
MTGPAQAHIFQLNISDGGVPKRPLRVVELTHQGLQGDRQADLAHHGGPDRALVLYSLERIVALQQEGHPIYPGSVGENVTVTGLDWQDLDPGARLQLGEAQIEITDYASPCSKTGGSFAAERYVRISQKKHPGWSRLCARVLVPGRLHLGDAVSLLP